MKISVLGSTGAMGGFVIKKEIIMNFTGIENKINDLLKKNKKRNKKAEFMIKYVVRPFSIAMKFMIYLQKRLIIKNDILTKEINYKK